MGDENPIRTLEDYSKPSHKGYMNTIELPVGNNVVPLRSDTIRLVQNGYSFYELWSEDPNQHLKDFLKLVDLLDLDGENRERTRMLQIFYDHVNPVTRRTIDQSAGGKLRDLNAEESWALLEDLALYDNESWNDPMDFAKLVKSIALPQDVPSTFDRRLFELENQEKRLSHLKTQLRQQQDDMIGKIILLWKIVFEKLNDASSPENAGNSMAPKSIVAISHDKREELRKKGIKSPLKLLFPKYLSPASIKELNKNPSSPKRVHFVYSIVILSTDSDTKEEDVLSTNACDLNLGGMVKGKEGVKEKGKEENEVETDIEESEFETDDEIEEILEEEEDDARNTLTLNTNLIISFIIKKSLKLTYVSDFMIVEDIDSVIDPRLSQVVLGRPFVEISNMTHDLSLGIVKFAIRADEVAYKMPHKIEQYSSLSDLEKEHTKAVYFRNEEEKRRGVDYVMNKILGFYKECLELGPEYLIGLEEKDECEVSNEGGVT
ncbi:hypothetical protein Tco_1368887 [Tanacetum coccineum]